MPAYCDLSPCVGMLPALGRFVFGDPRTGAYKMLVSGAGPVTIAYCPFCGTRLSNLELEATGKTIYLPDS